MKFLFSSLFILILCFYGIESGYILGDIAPQNFIETVTVLPILSPNNSVYEIKAMIDSATTSLEITNQYIYKWDSSYPWLQDGNPIMQSIYSANIRGVNVRVILESTVDTDNASYFLASMGIPVKYNTQLYNHVKGVIADGSSVCVSSVNLDETSGVYNRESGVIIYSSSIANYFLNVFNWDWNNGTTITAPSANAPSYTSATVSSPNPPILPWTSTLNITTFTNPDNAYAINLVTQYFGIAHLSIHGEMYELTYSDFEEDIANAKSANPNMDVSIIFSSNIVGSDLGTTQGYETDLFNSNCNPYSSSDIFTYTHAKYWMIDSVYAFVTTGNWAGTSLTPSYYSATPGGANREWGLLITDYCFTKWYDNVFQADRLIATPYDTPLHCSTFDSCGICGGSGTECSTQCTYAVTGSQTTTGSTTSQSTTSQHTTGSTTAQSTTSQHTTGSTTAQSTTGSTTSQHTTGSTTAQSTTGSTTAQSTTGSSTSQHTTGSTTAQSTTGSTTSQHTTGSTTAQSTTAQHTTVSQSTTLFQSSTAQSTTAELTTAELLTSESSTEIESEEVTTSEIEQTTQVVEGDQRDSSDKGSSKGVIIGAVVGVILGILLIVVVIMIIIVAIRKRRDSESYSSPYYNNVQMESVPSSSSVISTPSSPTTQRIPPKPPGSPAQRAPPKPPAQFTIGSKVQSKYSEDGKFYQAIIVDIGNNQYLVQYPDYGNFQEWRPGNCIRP